MTGQLTKVDRDEDFAAWCEQTAGAMERKEFGDLNWDGVVEEIRDLGKNDHRERKSRLRVLLPHLLKWQYPPAQNISGSWLATIREPALRSAVQSSWKNAVGLAADETGLAISTFPPSCPYESDTEIVNPDWVPTPTVRP